MVRNSDQTLVNNSGCLVQSTPDSCPSCQPFSQESLCAVIPVGVAAMRRVSARRSFARVDIGIGNLA